MAKLTERSIKKLPLPVGSGAREVPDDLLKGLVLVVHHSGAATWTVRYRTANGQQRRLTLGRHSKALNVDAARDLAASILRRVAKGEDPQAEKVAVRTAEVADAYPALVERFIKEYAKPRNRSWLETARVLGLRPNPVERKIQGYQPTWMTIAGSPADRWQSRGVATITRRDIAELVGGVVAQGKPIAANKLRVILGRYFGWLVEQGILDQSPVLGTKPPSPARSSDRVLSGREIALVWLAAGTLAAPFGSFVRLLILTAARRNEAAGMRTAELDGTTWTIPAERVKNGRDHELPLPPAAMAIIAKLTATKSGLLLSTNKTTQISGFSKSKRHLDTAVTKRNGGGGPIPEWTLHDLRRSASTGMNELGIAPHVVEKVLNHTVIIAGVAATYNKAAYRAEKREALKRWADHVADWVTVVQAE